MSDYIDDVFGVNGLLAQRFQGYSPRKGQIELARAVDEAIRTRGHLLAEAPTGTGKSLAYAVPAIYHVKQPRFMPPTPPMPSPDEDDFDDVGAGERHNAAEPPRGRVVIVTANIALQEQLVQKDLPLLKSLLPWPFTYALLKGVSNYVCKERQMIQRHSKQQHAEDEEQLVQIRAWADTTKTGDKSELSFEPSARAWSQFSTSSDECSGKDCMFYKNDCFPRQARKRAREADVIITNYALFFLDLLVVEKSNGLASVLPPYTIAILDEGHRAVDIARDYFGFRLSENAIDWASSMLNTDDKLYMHRAQQNFFGALKQYRKSPLYKARIRQQNVVNSAEVIEALRYADGRYAAEIERLFGEVEDPEQLTNDERKKYKQMSRRRDRLVQIEAQIKAAMDLYTMPKTPWKPHPETPAGDTAETRWYFSDPALGGDNAVANESQLRKIENIFFIDEEKNNHVALCSMPISVAEHLRNRLFGVAESVSVTSATLVAQGSFAYIARDLGVENAKQLIAESPFNWQQQALLITPVDVPEPNSPAFTNAVVDRFVQTMELARGRTLGLFTSYKNLNAAYEKARQRGQELGYRVLKQGDMPRTTLIEEFRKDVNSVLLGTESFWAGVDVQGESLSCVFIDRLPFATPDDPLLDALAEQDKNNWFMKYSVPQAIIAFKQGFGRLIRTMTDKGVVVVLDRRISTKSYGQLFILALPMVQRSTNLEDVRRFLDGEPLLRQGAMWGVG